MMTADAALKITEAEAALYDRQIRLWGLDAQKRMRASDVLVVGLSGLAAEVTKNITLAGINSLTILDDSLVTEEHMSAQFFVNKDHIGIKVAEASTSSLQKLNPLVKITADTDNVSNKNEEYFSKFHVVCMTCCDLNQLTRVNEICHRKNIKFFSGAVFGFYGYMFSDLIHHEYAEDRKIPKADNSEPQSKRSRPDPSKKVEMETITVKQSSSFTTLQSSLGVDWEKVTPQQLKKISPVYFIIRVLLDFATKYGCKPQPGDSTDLKQQAQQTMEKIGVDKSKISNNFMSLCTVAELSPVCAIVGGVLAQEILKAVSQRDAPHNNYFLYDPDTSGGIVECITEASFSSPKKTPQKTVVEEILL